MNNIQQNQTNIKCLLSVNLRLHLLLAGSMEVVKPMKLRKS